MGKKVKSASSAISFEKLAKYFVLAIFRNGEIENVHGGKTCPTCYGNSDYSHISNNEMRDIMRDAVNNVYGIFKVANEEPDQFLNRLQGILEGYVRFMGKNDHWDEPRAEKEIATFHKFLAFHDIEK